MTKIIEVKYAAPNKFIKAPYGTIYKVLNEDEKIERYIQLSPDPNFPLWEKLGCMFEKTFEAFLENEDFIMDCLRLYKLKEITTFNSITKIIKEN